MLQALITLVNPSYNAELWHGTLLVYGVLAICLLLTVALGKALPLIETSCMIAYVLGFFAVLVPMVYLAPEHASAETVFTTFLNGGGWGTQGLSFFVGLSGWAFAALGSSSKSLCNLNQRLTLSQGQTRQST